MQLEDLKNKKIGILGFWMEGQAVAKFLQEHQIAFDIFDQAKDPEYLKKIRGYEILFRSPGVRFFPEILAAQKKGTVVTSQIKYFFENCPAKIIGVTGTKGKGTTSKLIFDILQAAGISSYIGGNFGVGVLDLLGKLKPEDYVVLELSSFQLQDLEQSPHIAVVLMVTEEHLDYHADQAEYVQAKMPITKFQGPEDFAVINYDFENSRKIGELGGAKKYYFHSLSEISADFTDGVVADKQTGKIILIESGKAEEFLDIKDLTLAGYHNVQNISAAILAAKILGVDPKIIRNTAKSFRGLEHRLEFVTEKNGIKFYNDSIGTTPDACLAAVQSFEQNEIVIVGGFDKKGDYSQLGKDLAVQKNIKAAILIGQIAPQLEKSLKENHFSGKVMIGAQNMAEVFSQIKNEASAGDIVLLAPATSSFDWFKDYKDRGSQFKEKALNFNL